MRRWTIELRLALLGAIAMAAVLQFRGWSEVFETRRQVGAAVARRGELAETERLVRAYESAQQSLEARLAALRATGGSWRLWYGDGGRPFRSPGASVDETWGERIEQLAAALARAPGLQSLRIREGRAQARYTAGRRDALERALTPLRESGLIGDFDVEPAEAGGLLVDLQLAAPVGGDGR